MKRLLLASAIALVALLMSLPAGAQTTQTAQTSVPSDTVYLFKSWENILDGYADAMLVDPQIVAYTPYDVEFFTDDEELQELIHKDVIAATLGDSIWLINSQWLKDNFKGDAKKLDDFVPLFFNEKVALAVYASYSASVGMQILGGLMGDSEMFDPDPDNNPADYYYIDFDMKRVDKVDHKTLSDLLNDYHDLKMRYEGMKNYKDRKVIQNYLMEYVDRVSQDPTKPDILELINPAGPIQ